MRLQIKSFLLGFVLACLLPIAIIAVLWNLDGDHSRIFREQALASGKIIKVTSFYLVWGIEHSERTVSNDSFALEYVSSNANFDESALDKETLEVFELIRPISEQWGFDRATVAAFPTIQRKGKYHTYSFTRDSGGIWKFDRILSKVFIND